MIRGVFADASADIEVPFGCRAPAVSWTIRDGEAALSTWAEFVGDALELGAEAERRILGVGLVLIGTLRRDGTPRISPVEVRSDDGELELGMMWQSPKALDLLRDPRCVLHSLVTEKDGSEGDVKLTGRAMAIDDVAALDRYGVRLFAATGWRPVGEFHLFHLDIVEASSVRFDDDAEVVRSWRTGGIERVWEKPAP